MSRSTPIFVGACALLLSACAHQPMAPMSAMAKNDQSKLPEAVRVPVGHDMFLTTTGTGQIKYMCRAKPTNAAEFEWTFVGPTAKLVNPSKVEVGKYYGPPATWEMNDGSKLTATQVAIAATSPNDLPLQLVKANPAAPSGTLSGTSFIQRLAIKGGVTPKSSCQSNTTGNTEMVNYQADYLFWRAR
jgi:Protein of unknown function (DUF3455)